MDLYTISLCGVDFTQLQYFACMFSKNLICIINTTPMGEDVYQATLTFHERLILFTFIVGKEADL